MMAPDAHWQCSPTQFEGIYQRLNQFGNSGYERIALSQDPQLKFELKARSCWLKRIVIYICIRLRYLVHCGHTSHPAEKVGLATLHFFTENKKFITSDYIPGMSKMLGNKHMNSSTKTAFLILIQEVAIAAQHKEDAARNKAQSKALHDISIVDTKGKQAIAEAHQTALTTIQESELKTEQALTDIHASQGPTLAQATQNAKLLVEKTTYHAQKIVEVANDNFMHTKNVLTSQIEMLNSDLEKQAEHAETEKKLRNQDWLSRFEIKHQIYLEMKRVENALSELRCQQVTIVCMDGTLEKTIEEIYSHAFFANAAIEVVRTQKVIAKPIVLQHITPPPSYLEAGKAGLEAEIKVQAEDGISAVGESSATKQAVEVEQVQSVSVAHLGLSTQLVKNSFLPFDAMSVEQLMEQYTSPFPIMSRQEIWEHFKNIYVPAVKLPFALENLAKMSLPVKDPMINFLCIRAAYQFAIDPCPDRDALFSQLPYEHVMQILKLEVKAPPEEVIKAVKLWALKQTADEGAACQLLKERVKGEALLDHLPLKIPLEQLPHLLFDDADIINEWKKRCLQVLTNIIQEYNTGQSADFFVSIDNLDMLIAMFAINLSEEQTVRMGISSPPVDIGGSKFIFHLDFKRQIYVQTYLMIECLTKDRPNFDFSFTKTLANGPVKATKEALIDYNRYITEGQFIQGFRIMLGDLNEMYKPQLKRHELKLSIY